MCCCEEVHEGQSRKEMMCEKRCRGSDCVQGSTEMYSEWLMSQHFASTWASDTLRSIAQMDYLPNGSRQSSFLWVVSCASNIFRSDKSEHCCRLSVCFKTGFTSTYTLFFCLCCPSLSSISASLGKKWWIEKYSSRSVTFYCHYPCSKFFRKSQVISCR